MKPDHTLARHAGVILLKKGAANMSEIAELAGVSRQAVRKWAHAIDIDPVARRKKYLRELWRIVYGHAR